MTIHYLTEEEHVERMAKAIYLSHVRRVTMITGWDHVREDRREAFRLLAKDAVAGADRIRAAARQASADFAQSKAIAWLDCADATAGCAGDGSALALTLGPQAEGTLPREQPAAGRQTLNLTR